MKIEIQNNNCITAIKKRMYNKISNTYRRNECRQIKQIKELKGEMKKIKNIVTDEIVENKVIKINMIK